MEKVKDLIKQINSGLTQVSASKKDEIKIMTAMLNDRDFKISFEEDGKPFEYCIANDMREMVGSIISDAVKLPALEAMKLAENYEFKKAEASTLVDLSKDFVNTYLQTGRKLPLGPSVSTHISLSKKEVPASTRRYPIKVGVNPDGTGRYDHMAANVKPYESIRVHVPHSK